MSSYNFSGGGISASDANNGLEVVASKIGLGGELVRDTTVDVAGFDFDFSYIVGTLQTLLGIHNEAGGYVAGAFQSNLLTGFGFFSGVSGGQQLSNSLNSLTGEINGTLVNEYAVITKLGSDVNIEYINLIGVPQVGEWVTADTGATGVLQYIDATVMKIAFPVGDWVFAVSLSGDTSLFTADIDAMDGQQMLGLNSDNSIFLDYDERKRTFTITAKENGGTYQGTEYISPYEKYIDVEDGIGNVGEISVYAGSFGQRAEGVNRHSSVGTMDFLVRQFDQAGIYKFGVQQSAAGFKCLGLIGGVGGVTMFWIKIDGKICTNQTAPSVAIRVKTDEMPIYTEAGVLVGYIDIKN